KSRGQLTLRLQPGVRFWRLWVFQPAIGIGHWRAMVVVNHLISTCWGIEELSGRRVWHGLSSTTSRSLSVVLAWSSPGALCSHDAVGHLAEQVGMAVVTGVFLDHVHQHPAH